MAASSPTSIVSPHCIRRALRIGRITDNDAALIKGFAAKVSEVTLTKIAALAEAYSPYIEDDYVVKIDGSTDSSQ